MSCGDEVDGHGECIEVPDADTFVSDHARDGVDAAAAAAATADSTAVEWVDAGQLVPPEATPQGMSTEAPGDTFGLRELTGQDEVAADIEGDKVTGQGAVGEFVSSTAAGIVGENSVLWPPCGHVTFAGICRALRGAGCGEFPCESGHAPLCCTDSSPMLGQAAGVPVFGGPDDHVAGASDAVETEGEPDGQAVATFEIVSCLTGDMTELWLSAGQDTVLGADHTRLKTGGSFADGDFGGLGAGSIALGDGHPFLCETCTPPDIGWAGAVPIGN